MQRRVLFVAPSPGTRGGIAQFSANLAVALERRMAVEFLSYRRLYPRWTRAGRGGNAPDVTGSPLPASLLLVAWLPWTWISAGRRIARSRPDLLLIQWWHPAFGPCLAYLARRARRLGVPVAFVCHNCRPHEPTPLWRTLTRRSLRHADVLFALSKPVAAELERVVPGIPVRVVHHPPNIRPGDDPGGIATVNPWIERIGPLHGPVILFFGYVRPYKGLADLIDAMPAIRAEVPATLVVAGPFLESPKQFLRQAEVLGVAEAVRLFPGYVPDDEVESLFATADVLALPYRSASQSGVVPLAASFGLPVVATSTGGIPEVIGRSGIIVPPEDSAALAAGLVQAIREPPPPPTRSSETWDTWAREIALLPATVRAGAERRHPGLVRTAQVLLWGLVAYFVGSVLVRGILDLHGARLSFNLWLLAASSLLLVVSRVTDVACWRVLLRGAGANLRFWTAARIFTTAELVRFLPGGALHLAARYRFASKVGVSPLVIVTTTGLDLVLRILGGLVLFVASIPFWPSATGFTEWLAVAAIPAFVVLLHPKVLGGLVKLASRILRRNWVPVQLPLPFVAEAGALTALGWILRGASVFLATRSMVPISVGLLMPVAGAFSLAWVLGVVTPFVPGGLGVREAASASLMNRFLPLSSAIVVAVVVRLQGIAIELGTTGLAVALDRRAERRSSIVDAPTPRLHSSDLEAVSSDVRE